MKAIKSKMLIGTGLLTLGLLGAAFAQGMFGQQVNELQGYAQGTMGGMMGGKMGIMNIYPASARPISQEEARGRAQEFATRYGQAAKIRDFMIFSENYYVQVVDAKSGLGLGELLVDRYTGVVQPEHGPNMMWNTQLGMTGGMGMMGGNTTSGNMMGGSQNQGATSGNMMGTTPNQGVQTTPTAVRYTLASAQKLADTFVTGYLPGGKVLEGLSFPGYYTFDYGRKDIEGMLSVNAYTGQIWVHTWHGLFLGEGK